ncbi:MAG: hypothetical protein DMG33_06620 [Acidobacteria bacterium]|nr:MAG: hypothetical protein DMG33_06620 [Acidobacteriota bacterium]
MENHSHSEDESADEESPEDVDSRLEDFESRLEDLEAGAGAGGYGAASAGYGLGATLAVILSWESNHAIIWALLHGLLSWFYVIYYIVKNWETVRLF